MKHYTCAVLAFLFFSISSAFGETEPSIPGAETGISAEVRATSTKSIAVKPVDPALFDLIQINQVYSTKEGWILKAKGKRNGLVALFWEGQIGKTAKGDLITLIPVPADEDGATEFLKQQEGDGKLIPTESPETERSFMDLDFFHAPGEISVAVDAGLIIKESTSVTINSGNASGELNTTGITSALQLQAGIFPRVSVFGKFNYVSKKTKTTTNNAPEKESQFSGIDDPEIGVSIRFHERENKNDFTSTVTMSFQPSLNDPEYGPNGQTKRGLGYTVSTLSAPFSWRHNNLEFSIGPHFTLLGKGGWDGVDGRKSGNFDPAFLFAVEGKTLYSISRAFRLGGALGLIFPHTRESEQLFSPVVREEDEYPFMFRLNFEPQISLNSRQTLVLVSSVNGLIATGKLEATLRQGNASVTGKANSDSWTFRMGMKYLF